MFFESLHDIQGYVGIVSMINNISIITMGSSITFIDLFKYTARNIVG